MSRSGSSSSSMSCAAATALPSSTSLRHERAQVRPLADAAVRQAGERAERVRRGVEDHLAPLRAARVGDRVRRACRRACRRRRGARSRPAAPAAARTGRRSCRPSRPSARAPARRRARPGTSCRGSRARRARRSPPRCRSRSAPTRRQPSANACAVAATAADVCIAFVATMPKSHGGSSLASVVARTRPTSSPAPESRRPCALIASTCSRARSYAQTSTSSSCARFAANSEPTAPQPTTQTLTPCPSGHGGV